MINTVVNKIRKTHEDKYFVGIENEDGLSKDDLIATIKQLQNSNLSDKAIQKEILPILGIKVDSIPSEILE